MTEKPDKKAKSHQPGGDKTRAEVIRTELSIDFPDSVLEILAALQQEWFVESIWFIGSRANHCATPDSDWDFIVFSSVEPEVVPRRRPDIDIVRIGPSGRGLVEGVGAVEFSFQNWQWSRKDKVTASYIGMKFIESEGGIRDCSDPVYQIAERSAYLIWSRDARDPNVAETEG